MRILYVEDNPANVSLVKRVAREHELVNYIDGEEALRNFERDNPDLVLMDIQLTGRLSGLDVVRELRQQGYTVPIIAVTAYAMIGDRERCLAAGCDDYMAKPLPIPDLLRLFEKRKQELAELASLVPAVATVTTTPEVKAEAPSVELKPTVTPTPEVKVETLVVDNKPVVTEAKTETTATPPTDVKPVATTPVSEVKVEATPVDVKPVVTEIKVETSVTPPVDAKVDVPVIDGQAVVVPPVEPQIPEAKTEISVADVKPTTDVKAEGSLTDAPKIDDAPKVDTPNTSNEKGEGDIKVTP